MSLESISQPSPMEKTTSPAGDLLRLVNFIRREVHYQGILNFCLFSSAGQ